MKNRKLLTLFVTALIMIMSVSIVLGTAGRTALKAYAEETTDTSDTTVDSSADSSADTSKAAADANNEAGNKEEAGEEEKKELTWWQKYGSIIIMILVYGGLFALLYFLLIRPQQKKRKEEEQLRASLMLGDSVTSIGGIVGRVVKIQDDEVTLETSIDRSLVTIKNWAVRDIKHVETDDEE